MTKGTSTRGIWKRAPLLLAAIGIAWCALGAADGAAAAAVPGEVLVKLRSGGAIAPLLTRYGLTLKDRSGPRPIFRLGLLPMADLRATVDALRLEPEVLLAEENALNDSPEARKNLVWAIGTLQQYQEQWAAPALRLQQAQGLSAGTGIRVAVLDTGVDAAHPLLAGRVLPGHDFVDGDLDPAEGGGPNDAGFGHGTHVAGIVLTGAPGALILPLRVLDAHGSGDAWALARAMLFAVDPDGNPATDDGAHVINLSLGTPARTRLLTTIARLASCAFLAVAPDRADPIDDVSDPGYNDDRTRCQGSRGAVIMAAAGNDGSTAKEYPAAESVYGLAAVGASDDNLQLAPFSNRGSWVGLAAPGARITSSAPGGGYATWSGTSMATPWASAAAAMLLARDPLLAPRDVVRRLEKTASPLCGTPLLQIDPYAALLDAPVVAVHCP